MIKRLLALASTALAILFFTALSRRMGVVPELGMLMSPFEGAWRNAESTTPEDVPELSRISGLKSPVQVWFDSSMVPHIAARNLDDLYFTQGYVAARLRLWQMDFFARLAAGRISEVAGKQAIELDKFQRRIGMVYGAQNSLDSMMRNPISKLMLERFTQGVNAYIANTDARSYPIEYKVMGFEPEAWTPLKTALVIKYLSYTLTLGNEDVNMTALRDAFSPADLNDLFPNYPSQEAPIIPTDPAWKTWTVPAAASAREGGAPSPLPAANETKVQGLGSNNWVVSRLRSAPGRGPFLCNDPHLDFIAPCIWVQMHLSCPGMNVQGVTLPGIPGVIIGFNKDIAWGVTNVDADVLDFFKTDLVRQGEGFGYTTVSGIKKASFKIEEIAVRDSGTVRDTVFYAGKMPIVYRSGEKPFKSNFPPGYALRWTAHEASNELFAFYKINTARDYGNYLTAMRYLSNPAQNVVYADRKGNYALWVNGRFPIKARNQGKFIFNSIDGKAVWGESIPQDQKPHALNHPHGYLASANQSSTDTTYPYYLNWEFATPSRGLRINDRLGRMQKANQDSMSALQADNLGLTARRCLPRLLALLERDQVSEPGRELVHTLREWNYRYDSSEIAPSMFEQWVNTLSDTLWDEVRTYGGKRPTRDRLALMLEGRGDMKWVDVQATKELETLPELVTVAFNKAMADLTHTYGAAGQNWRWGRVKRTEFGHMGRIPGMGFGFISASGSWETVNATGKRHGPSWRMIVECGADKVRAWGIIPGGQSGNPGSRFYNDQLEEWRTNRLRSINFAPADGDGNGKAIHIIRLMPD